MKIKAYICPSCGVPLDVNYDTTFTFCPNCGNRLHISYEGEAAPQNPDLRQFTDANTGTPLASAVVPPDYTLKGALNTQWQSDAVPFTATVQAVSPDRSVILTSSKETFEKIRDPIQKKMVARIPVAAPAWLRDFMEPEAYLQQYAEGMLGVPVTPIARAALPSVFGTHLQEEKAKLLAFFNAHAININVRLEVSNLVCDPILSSTAGNMQRGALALSSGISISRLLRKQKKPPSRKPPHRGIPTNTGTTITGMPMKSPGSLNTGLNSGTNSICTACSVPANRNPTRKFIPCIPTGRRQVPSS